MKYTNKDKNKSTFWKKKYSYEYTTIIIEIIYD